MKLTEMIYKTVALFKPADNPIAGSIALLMCLGFALALVAMAGHGVGTIAHNVGQLAAPRILSASWLKPSTMVFAKLS